MDYIIRVEDLQSGIAEVTEILNDRAGKNGESLRLNPNLADVNINGNRKSDEREKDTLCSFYRGENAICGVALEKTMDPQVLGYKNYCQ